MLCYSCSSSEISSQSPKCYMIHQNTCRLHHPNLAVTVFIDGVQFIPVPSDFEQFENHATPLNTFKSMEKLSDSDFNNSKGF